MSEGGPLTAAEATTIVSTWRLVQADLKGNGVKFFIHFFTGFPEYQKIFRGFADIPLSELSTNKRLTAHAYTVFSTITALVENLDDPEVLTELLLNVGRSHHKRKLNKGDFENLRESLLEFLGKALEDKWTTDVEVAWKKTLTLVTDKIGEGLLLAAELEK